MTFQAGVTQKNLQGPLSLDFCQRQLFSLVDPEYEDECIMYFGPYGVCYPIRYVYVGDVIDDAVPCSQQTMTSELKWPDIHFYAEDPPPPSKHHPCSSGYYCEEEDIIGQITANVVP